MLPVPLTLQPVFRGETSSQLAAHDCYEDEWHTVEDDTQLIHPPDEVAV